MTSLNIAIFAGGLSWPVYIAKDQEFFAEQGLDVHITEVADSVKQMKGLMAGDFHVVMTPFDNVAAYQEGQGEVPLDGTSDFFAFMGGISGSLRLIVDPKVNSFEELRGTTLGVDAEHTGYTLAMYKLLADHGIVLGSYLLSKVGGTTYRVKALTEGKISATMVRSPQEIVPEENGFKRLGDVTPMIGPYQAVSGVASRAWAAHSGASLRAFIKAYLRASDWLSSSAHREQAVAIFLQHIASASDGLARRAWDLMVGQQEGFQLNAKFDPAGAETVLRIRSQFGRPVKQLTDWTRYVDESFYVDALKSET